MILLIALMLNIHAQALHAECPDRLLNMQVHML